MDYAKAIRTIRAAKGLAQKDLSKSTKLDPSYISKIESGQRLPTIETLELIADALQVPLHLLILLASSKDDLATLAPEKRDKIAELLLELLVDTKSQ